jgi:hypothetical protein
VPQIASAEKEREELRRKLLVLEEQHHQGEAKTASIMVALSDQQGKEAKWIAQIRQAEAAKVG